MLGDVVQVFLCLLVAVLVSGVPAAGGRTLTVFAAASLTEALREAGDAYARERPGVAVRFSFAASSLLRAQIEQGAPADLFVPADRAQMEPLARARRVEAPVEVARNRLVVVTPAANPGRIRGLQDLARPGLRLALTAEQVPIGRYTRQALAKMSRRDALGADFGQRMLENVVSQETNVRALLTKVELGELDAAIVYASDAVAGGRKVRVIAIPARYNEVAVYPAAVVAGAPNAAEARRFLTFLRGRTTQAILRKHGFLPR